MSLNPHLETGLAVAPAGGRAPLLRALFSSKYLSLSPPSLCSGFAPPSPAYFSSTQEASENEGNVLSRSPPDVAESGVAQGPLLGLIMAYLRGPGLP